MSKSTSDRQIPSIIYEGCDDPVYLIALAKLRLSILLELWDRLRYEDAVAALLEYIRCSSVRSFSLIDLLNIPDEQRCQVVVAIYRLLTDRERAYVRLTDQQAYWVKIYRL